jgi:para-aminobenzoate synthetase/4-amino-4-deoxychorismate lyase
MPVQDTTTMMAERPGRTAARAPFVLLDDSLTQDGRALLFENPEEIIRCDEPGQAGAALERLAAAAGRGLTAAGYLAYELGYLLEPKLAHLIPKSRTHPLIWMGLFERARELDGAGVRRLLAGRGNGGHRLERPRLSIRRDDYLKAAARVKDYIAAGDVYQINLTFKYLFDFTGDPLSLYGELSRKQRVAHGGVIRAGDFDVISLSPELFLSVSDRHALTKPMKGTAPRGITPDADAEMRRWLRSDEKSRAENLMIVDLLRNDLGRVAEIGSVEAPALFTVETYPTLHQMTSSVTGRLRPGIGAAELIRALFPCGSVTGAPKLRAMEIIRELEAAPRGVYTGAVGMIAPNGDTRLNVAIRTVVLDPGGGGEMGIGSGIVHDSDPAAEYDECLLKADFLTKPQQPFKLIETLRWGAEEGYVLLERHIERLSASAAYFGFRCDLAKVRRRLDDLAAGFATGTRRVRLLLGHDGDVELTAVAMEMPGPDTVYGYVLSGRPIDPGDPLVYHKTTRRELYDGEFARLSKETGCDEVLFTNTRGELAEGSRTNIFIERDGGLLTPPIRCGLLDGTLRRDLLDDPNVMIEEQVLTPADLEAAERVYLGNSVRGLVPARPLT